MVSTYTLADLRRLENRLSQPIDPELEMWDAARRRFVRDGADVRRVDAVGGGSLTAPMPTDLIYSNQFSYTSKNTFTAEAQINDTVTGNPPVFLQAGFFDATYGRGKTLRIVARGQILTTTAGPTWAVTARFDSLTGTLLGQGGPGTGSTASLVASTIDSGWEFEMDVIARVLGAGTNATFQGQGQFSGPGLIPTVKNIWGGNAPPGTVTGDSTVQHQLWIDAICGTSNAANGITLFQLLVLALN